MTEAVSEIPVNWRAFGRRWLATLVAVLVRAVHEPALAFDLATETLAGAQTRWAAPAPGEQALVDVLGLAARLLDQAADEGRVSATERRRWHVPARHLTDAESQELTRLSEAAIVLPPEARTVAEELARRAPSPHTLAAIRLSGLVAPPPDREPAYRDT